MDQKPDKKQFPYQHLQALLNTPQAPSELATQLHANLRQQLVQQQQQQWWRRKDLRIVASAACVLGLAISLSVAFYPAMPPALVSAAYRDAVHDVSLKGRMDPDYPAWLASYRLRELPVDYALKLAKNCKLDSVSSKHLRFDSAQTGVVNLFVLTEPFQAAFPASQKGMYQGKKWLLLKPDKSLTVLALYDQDVDEEKISKAVQEFLPAEITL